MSVCVPDLFFQFLQFYKCNYIAFTTLVLYLCFCITLKKTDYI
jgi:hypothetical protein